MLVAPLAIGHECRRDQNEKYNMRGLGFCRRGGYHGMVSIFRFVSPCYVAPSALWNFDGFASSPATYMYLPRMLIYFLPKQDSRSTPVPFLLVGSKVCGSVSRQRVELFLCRFSYYVHVVRVDLAVCLSKL